MGEHVRMVSGFRLLSDSDGPAVLVVGIYVGLTMAGT
jgi:hypothetical protein